MRKFLPYRAGYEADDRREIERRLRKGALRGVVSTSALELGIDIPSLRVGLNLGVPPTRKAYRQRLGRVGRKGPGVFVVIATHNAFQMYGTSFREYHDMSVEPSYLYLDNRFMQFAHARCLAVELESLGAPSKTPPRVVWPDGFRDIHKMARPGGNRSKEFDGIADLGGDTPHHGYPLRNVGEARFQITMRYTDKKIGEMNQTQALRECYPGATYFHLLRAYKVIAWHTNVFDSSIRVTPTAPFLTQPKIITWVNADLTSNGILENHIIRGEHGFLAECQMQVTERVEGYYDHKNNFYDYRELQQKNSNMRAISALAGLSFTSTEIGSRDRSKRRWPQDCGKYSSANTVFQHKTSIRRTQTSFSAEYERKLGARQVHCCVRRDIRKPSVDGKVVS